MKPKENLKADDVEKRICSIFVNNPTESFRYKYFNDLKMGNEKTYNSSSIKSALRRLTEKKIIRKYKHTGQAGYRYILLDREKAIKFIEKDLSGSFKDVRSIPMSHPVSKPRDYLTHMIPKEEHHKFYQIRLTEDEWKRTEHLFTKPKNDNDRGRQRQLERRSFKINISQNTLRGVLWLLDDDWLPRLSEIYPDMAREVQEKIAFKGESIDADMWAKFKLKSEDLQVIFASSHYWKELDAEGRELIVNTFLQNIVKTSFEKTIYEAQMTKVLEHILENQKSKDERDLHLLDALTTLSIKLEERMDKHSQSLEQISEVLKKLLGEEKPKTEAKEDVIPELKDDCFMYG